MPRKTKTIRDRGSRNSRKYTKRVLNGGGVFTKTYKPMKEEQKDSVQISKAEKKRQKLKNSIQIVPLSGHKLTHVDYNEQGKPLIRELGPDAHEPFELPKKNGFMGLLSRK